MIDNISDNSGIEVASDKVLTQSSSTVPWPERESFSLYISPIYSCSYLVVSGRSYPRDLPGLHVPLFKLYGKRNLNKNQLGVLVCLTYFLFPSSEPIPVTKRMRHLLSPLKPPTIGGEVNPIHVVANGRSSFFFKTE